MSFLDKFLSEQTSVSDCCELTQENRGELENQTRIQSVLSREGTMIVR